MLDNYVTGGSGFVGRRLIGQLPHSVHIRHQELRKCEFDYVKSFFFLSTYGNMPYHADSSMILRANVQDLFYVLENMNVPQSFVYVSSSSVTLTIQTPYSRAKRAAEEILQALPELKSCIVRPFSICGVGEQKEHLIPTLIRSCMEGEEMPFDPYPVHDFIDVSDIVDALVFLADNEVTGIVELGNGLPVTNKEVLEVVEKECGRKANVRLVNRLRNYDTSSWFCRDKRASELGWKPKKNFKQSISEMVNHYRNDGT